MALVGRPLNNLGYREPDPRANRPRLRELQSVSTESQSIRLEDPTTYQITPTLRDSFFRGQSSNLTPATSIKTALYKDKSNVFDSRQLLKQSSIKTSPQLKTYSPITIGLKNYGNDNETKTEPDYSPYNRTIPSPIGRFNGFQNQGSPLISTKRVSHLMAYENSSPLNSPLKTQTPSRQMSSKYFGSFDQSANMNIYQPQYRTPVSREVNYTSGTHNQSMIASSNLSRGSPSFNPLATKLGVSQHQSLVSYPEQCKCRRSDNGMCELAESWKTYFIRKPQDESIVKNSYQSCLRDIKNPNDIDQIEKDVMRTYPELDVYNPGSSSSKRLINVLSAIASRFPAMGYVQGMNFICGSLIYHLKEEHLTFGLFCYLVEFLNLQEVYKDGIPILA